MTSAENNGRWNTRNKLLTFAGLFLIQLEWVNAELLGRTFHGEFLLAGLALCGVAIATKSNGKN